MRTAQQLRHYATDCITKSQERGYTATPEALATFHLLIDKLVLDEGATPQPSIDAEDHGIDIYWSAGDNLIAVIEADGSHHWWLYPDGEGGGIRVYDNEVPSHLARLATRVRYPVTIGGDA